MDLQGLPLPRFSGPSLVAPSGHYYLRSLSWTSRISSCRPRPSSPGRSASSLSRACSATSSLPRRPRAGSRRKARQTSHGSGRRRQSKTAEGRKTGSSAPLIGPFYCLLPSTVSTLSFYCLYFVLLLSGGPSWQRERPQGGSPRVREDPLGTPPLSLCQDSPPDSNRTK